MSRARNRADRGLELRRQHLRHSPGAARTAPSRLGLPAGPGNKGLLQRQRRPRQLAGARHPQDSTLLRPAQRPAGTRLLLPRALVLQEAPGGPG